jgi:hypothetical protein
MKRDARNARKSVTLGFEDDCITLAARQSGCDERDNRDERAAPVADRREGVARP